MKKRIILPLLFVVCCTIFAEQNLYSIQTTIGIMSREVHEYAYQGDSVISRLDWNETTTPFFGINGSVLVNSFLLSINLESAVALKSGSLQDFDFSTSYGGVISQYSQHELYLDKDFSIAGNIKYVVNLASFSLLPKVGYAYRNVKLSAQDGYLQYPESGVWDPDAEKTYVQGTLISYEQVIYYPYLGLDINWILSCRFALTFITSYGFNVCIDSVDSHYSRALRFCDSMRGGHRFTIGVCGQFKLSYFSRTLLLFGCEYINMPLVRGTTSSGVIGVSDTGPQIDKGYGSGVLRAL